MSEKAREKIREANVNAFSKIKTDGTIDVYNLLRKYMEHEDSLVHQRTSWFLTLNSFLFASVALVLSADAEKFAFSRAELTAFLVILAVIGTVSSVVAFLGISAAYASTKAIKDTWVDKYEPLAKDFGLNAFHRPVDDDDFEIIKRTTFRNDPTRLLPYIKGGGGRYSIARRGRYLANGMPVLIGASWILFIFLFGV